MTVTKTRASWNTYILLAVMYSHVFHSILFHLFIYFPLIKGCNHLMSLFLSLNNLNAHFTISIINSPWDRERLTSAWPMINSAHVFHCGHLSLSSNVVSSDPQQHCSWLYHNPLRQMPSFRSVIQSAAMSINPANAPTKTRRRWQKN